LAGRLLSGGYEYLKEQEPLRRNNCTRCSLDLTCAFLSDAFFGYIVEAVDAESAIQAAIAHYDIKSPHEQTRLAVKRVREIGSRSERHLRESRWKILWRWGRTPDIPVPVASVHLTCPMLHSCNIEEIVQ